MIIDKSELRTLWYTDKDGQIIEASDDLAVPEGAVFQHVRFPLQISENVYEIIKQEDVDTCKHRHKQRTGGWIKGTKGRKCLDCGGTQVVTNKLFWSKQWSGGNSVKIFEGRTTYGSGEDVIVAMVNKGDYTLSEAILVYSTACERCMNVLQHEYTDGKEGYAEFSDEWHKCNTVCLYCTYLGEGKLVNKSKTAEVN